MNDDDVTKETAGESLAITIVILSIAVGISYLFGVFDGWGA